MKSRINFFTFWILLLSTTMLVAHGGEDHDKKQEDTLGIIQENSNPLTSSHQHSARENHLMIKESEIVDATLDDFSNLHPLVVHFPIVLLLLALVTQVVSFFLWKKQLNWGTLLLLVGGFLGAYIASTFIHPHTTGLSDAAELVLEKHDLFADYTIWLSGLGLLLKGINMFLFKEKFWLEMIIALILAGAAFSVSKAGHYGATLAHIHGVGVQGKFIELHEEGHNH